MHPPLKRDKERSTSQWAGQPRSIEKRGEEGGGERDRERKGELAYAFLCQRILSEERERERERFSVLAQKRNGPSKLPALTYPLPPKRPNCGTVSDKSGMS